MALALEPLTQYGGVVLVNIIASGLYLVVLGMKVGAARKKFTDKVSSLLSLLSSSSCPA
jgi:hypothetical protein